MYPCVLSVFGCGRGISVGPPVNVTLISGMARKIRFAQQPQRQPQPDPRSTDSVSSSLPPITARSEASSRLIAAATAGSSSIEVAAGEPMRFELAATDKCGNITSHCASGRAIVHHVDISHARDGSRIRCNGAEPSFSMRLESDYGGEGGSEVAIITPTLAAGHTPTVPAVGRVDDLRMVFRLLFERVGVVYMASRCGCRKLCSTSTTLHARAAGGSPLPPSLNCHRHRYSCISTTNVGTEHGWMAEWLNGWMDGWMDGWMNG